MNGSYRKSRGGSMQMRFRRLLSLSEWSQKVDCGGYKTILIIGYLQVDLVD